MEGIEGAEDQVGILRVKGKIMNEAITTIELDGIARLGLDDMRSCFQVNAPEGSAKRAELALKILRESTSRRSSDNSRLAINLKVAKAAGVSQKDLRWLWKQIAAGHVQQLNGGEDGEPSAET
jgi:hypothetical protein